MQTTIILLVEQIVIALGGEFKVSVNLVASSYSQGQNLL